MRTPDRNEYGTDCTDDALRWNAWRELHPGLGIRKNPPKEFNDIIENYELDFDLREFVSEYYNENHEVLSIDEAKKLLEAQNDNL